MNHGLPTEEESHCIVTSGNILFEELEGSSKERSCWSKQWPSPRKGAYNMILQGLQKISPYEHRNVSGKHSEDNL